MAYKVAHEITNADDIIDSRDVIARIDELEAERSDLQGLYDSALDGADESEQDECRDNLDAWDADEGIELKALIALRDEADGYADWQYGETLIRDSYFETYARDLAEDIGAIDKAARWPNTCIDWEEAAEQLQQDYTSVEFDGVTYWIRS